VSVDNPPSDGSSATGYRDREGKNDSVTCDLKAVLSRLEKLISPLWPLADYVAVNPFVGMSDRRFLDARHLLVSVRQCDPLPGSDYLQSLLEKDAIPRRDFEAAYEECQEEYPDWFDEADRERLLRHVDEKSLGDPPGEFAERGFLTVAEVVDRDQNTRWQSHITTEISRHCAAHFDRGQATWPSPWRGLPLYEAWLKRAGISKRLDSLGISGFRGLMGFLPTEPDRAIRSLLEMLGVPQEHWEGVLLSQLMSISGWAAFIRFQSWNSEETEAAAEDLVGLLAIRLTCDVALAKSSNLTNPAKALIREGAAVLAPRVAGACDSAYSPSLHVRVRYLVLKASEVHYRRRLLDRIDRRTVSRNAQNLRPLVQMVFCIDVRSEVFRRHLEEQNEAIVTSGFAGFFGIPLEFVRLGASWGAAHCPVLITPSITVQEGIRNASHERLAEVSSYRRRLRKARKAWKIFQTSAISCFSFVESLGLGYLPKLFTDSMGLTPPVGDPSLDGLTDEEKQLLGPDLDDEDTSLSTEARAGLAEKILRGLGMLENFAEVVVFCGHASKMVNNPYQAGYDCGACGGHSGEPNARAAAALLNDPAVRELLGDRGIAIPENTRFLAAVHCTTTDEVKFFDLQEVPETFVETVGKAQRWCEAAGEAARHERSGRMRNASDERLLYRARDWSEVRPEWGLAGNAAFIVGDRTHTLGEDLRGRTFLHDYDASRDPAGEVLEAIMTAPMVVTSWINLQYYASAADNRGYGSGSKVIHDVVGQFGILEGNGGDLMTGLPWQAVHDGSRFQHEPLRLLVVIEATREAVASVLTKHEGVRQLAENGWLSLVVREASGTFRRTASGEWRMLE